MLRLGLAFGTMLVVLAGCSLSLTPTASMATPPSPSASEPPIPSAIATPLIPAETPLPSAIAAAKAVVEAYTRLLIKGDWSAAYAALAPNSRIQWGSLANYTEERSAYFKSADSQFTVTIPSSDVWSITIWQQQMFGTPLDIEHGVLVEVDYPRLAGNNAGFTLYVVQPGPDGLQLFQVR